MGFTPWPVCPWALRCGDIDAGILEYLMNKHGYDIKEMLSILNKKSGVLGISGVSSDFRDLENAAPRATSGLSWRWIPSSTASPISSAPTPPPWAEWTPSSHRRMWVRTARRTA